MERTLTTDFPSTSVDSFLKQITSAFFAVVLGAMLATSSCDGSEDQVDMHPRPEQRAVLAQ